MRFALLFLLLLPVVIGHTIQEQTTAGPYTIQLSTLPEQLEPGSSTIIIAVVENGTAVTDKDVLLRLSEGNKIFFATTSKTDTAGTMTLKYYFNTPGTYELTLAIDDNRTTLPVHVHGQYILIFGFLTAILIVLALLLERL